MAKQSQKRPPKPNKPSPSSLKDKESQQKDHRPDVKLPPMTRDPNARRSG
jgi:hypothetical protein